MAISYRSLLQICSNGNKAKPLSTQRIINMDKKQLNKLVLRLRDLRRLRRKAKALEPLLKAAYEAYEIDILKSFGERKAIMRNKYSAALIHYSYHLSFILRLNRDVSKLEAQLAQLKNQQQEPRSDSERGCKQEELKQNER